MELPLRKELFWDVNINNLDMNLHKRLIIERVFSLGNLKEFRTIMEYYGRAASRFTPKTSRTRQWPLAFQDPAHRMHVPVEPRGIGMWFPWKIGNDSSED